MKSEHQITLRKRDDGYWECAFPECDITGCERNPIRAIEAMTLHLRNAVSLFERNPRGSLGDTMLARRKALEVIGAISERIEG